MERNLIQHLRKRGFIDTLSSDQIERFVEKPTKIYVGFDPTADSLHLGNLIGIMALAHCQRLGHTPVVVLGGTTGRIGDPSGKSVERPLLDSVTINYNSNAIRSHFEKILDFSGELPKPIILNNDQWYQDFKLIDYLRDVGKYFRLGSMLSKDTVKSRMESEEGISYTEFSYQIIQAYDFYRLHADYGVTIQMGGSDQWGNITSGIEFSRKVAGATVYGLTWPLLTRSDGKKFGKTADGAIWLSSEKCLPYQFYQYLFRMPDADVIHMLKMLTFVDCQEIALIEKSMQKSDYEPNTAQKKLAEEVTRLLHGEEGLQTALKVTKGAMPGKEAKLDFAVLKEISRDFPSIKLNYKEVIGKKYADLAVLSGLVSSKGEANRLLKNGGGYINNQKIMDVTFKISSKDLLEKAYILIGAGKKKKILIQVI